MGIKLMMIFDFYNRGIWAPREIKLVIGLQDVGSLTFLEDLFALFLRCLRRVSSCKLEVIGFKVSTNIVRMVIKSAQVHRYLTCVHQVGVLLKVAWTILVTIGKSCINFEIRRFLNFIVSSHSLRLVRFDLLVHHKIILILIHHQKFFLSSRIGIFVVTVCVELLNFIRCSHIVTSFLLLSVRNCIHSLWVLLRYLIVNHVFVVPDLFFAIFIVKLGYFFLRGPKTLIPLLFLNCLLLFLLSLGRGKLRF